MTAAELTAGWLLQITRQRVLVKFLCKAVGNSRWAVKSPAAVLQTWLVLVSGAVPLSPCTVVNEQPDRSSSLKSSDRDQVSGVSGHGGWTCC